MRLPLPPPVMAGALAAVVLASPGAAQSVEDRLNPEPVTNPGWVNDLSLTAVNGAFAGLSAGVRQALSGGSFWDGFQRGALGGAVAYGGRRLAGTELPGRRFVARQVGAVGVSMVENAATGRGTLDRLFIPLGPLALEWSAGGDGADGGGDRGDDGDRGGWSLSVDAYDVLRIGDAVLDPDLSLAWGETLSSGVPVFVSRDNRLLDRRDVNGAAAGSVIFLSSAPDGTDPELDARRVRVLDHEMVHVVQQDLLNRLWFNPFERVLLNEAGVGGAWTRHVRLSLVYPGVRELFGTFGYSEEGNAPLEVEARWVEGVRGSPPPGT